MINIFSMSTAELSPLPYVLSEEEFETSQQLIEQIGGLDETFFTAGDELTPLNPDLQSRLMAVRYIIREAILAKSGFSEVKWIPDNGEVLTLAQHSVVLSYKRFARGERISGNVEIDRLVGKPAYQAYDWDRFCVWNIGNFASLRAPAGNGLIIDSEKGVVLFVDEVEQLAKGEIVTTFHSAGLEHLGFLTEEKEAYIVAGGNLHRVRASFTD